MYFFIILLVLIYKWFSHLVSYLNEFYGDCYVTYIYFYVNHWLFRWRRSVIFSFFLKIFSFLSFGQSLSHVAPLRNYFLKEENYNKIKRPPGSMDFLLVQRFGELIRKLWNPCNFKAHVSPHEMLQAVVLCSKKKFQITEQG